MLSKRIIRLDEVDSTNEYIKRNDLEEGTIVIAKNQTSGKGRLGRTWVNDRTDNLMMSISLKLGDVKDAWKIGFIAAASIHDLLKDFNITSQIKWPNDLIVNNKKIAGVLVETKVKDDIRLVVLGIGVNVNIFEFKELSSKATSMKNETNHSFDLEEVFASLIGKLDYYYDDFLNKGKLFLEVCNDKSFLIGKEIVVDELKFEYVSCSDDGELILKRNGVSHNYLPDEISLENIY